VTHEAGRTARLAENEMLFRQVNEIISSTVAGIGDSHKSGFACECARATCTEEVSMTSPEYETVRRDPRWFLIRPGHAVKDIEQVVKSTDRYEVVEKTAEPGPSLATGTDPRS
jgi:hypothetical protein